jgi:hypothetical protein
MHFSLIRYPFHGRGWIGWPIKQAAVGCSQREARFCAKLALQHRAALVIDLQRASTAAVKGVQPHQTFIGRLVQGVVVELTLNIWNGISIRSLAF